MVTISKPLSAGQAQAYHKEEFTNARQNYYTHGDQIQGEWQGQLAERWGLNGRGQGGAVPVADRGPTPRDW